MSNCIICGHISEESESLPGLFYCIECGNYYYLPQNKTGYSIPDVLLAIKKLSGELYEERTLSIVANICDDKECVFGLFYDLYKEIVKYKSILFEENRFDSQFESVANKISRKKYCSFEWAEYVLNCYAYAEGVITTQPQKKDSKVESLIKRFSVDKEKVLKGEKVLISWNVSKKAFLFIDGKKEKINGKGSKSLCPINTTSIRIELKDNGDVFFDEKIVEVISHPKIESFTSSKTIGLESELITLKWETHEADQLFLTGSWNGNMDVTGKGEFDIRLPEVDAIYTLIAKNRCSTVSESIFISVKKTPKFPVNELNCFNVDSLNIDLPSIQLESFNNNLDLLISDSSLTDSHNQLFQEIEVVQKDVDNNLFRNFFGNEDLYRRIQKILEKIIF